MTRLWTIVCIVLAALPLAHAEEHLEPDDARQLRANPVVYTDGHGHYVAYASIELGKQFVKTPVFYGDKNTLYFFARAPAMSNGGVSLTSGFRGALFSLDDTSGVKAACADRNVKLTRLEPREAKRLVGAVKFAEAPSWERLPVRLARDDLGVYFYVDAKATVDNMSDYRIFIGKRGAVTQERLKDVVVDSSGELYITERGTFKVNNYTLIDRSVGDKNSKCSVRPPEMWWIVKGRASPLTMVIPEANADLIYQSLGAYTGEKFGTPCDVL